MQPPPPTALQTLPTDAWPLIERYGVPAVLLLVVIAVCLKLIHKMLADRDAEISRLRSERDHFRDRAEAAHNQIRRDDHD